jgi:hypothetical protein
LDGNPFSIQFGWNLPRLDLGLWSKVLDILFDLSLEGFFTEATLGVLEVNVNLLDLAPQRLKVGTGGTSWQRRQQCGGCREPVRIDFRDLGS